MRIKFLKNPVGRYNLSYEVGEVVDLPDSQCLEMIEEKYAEKTVEPIKSNSIHQFFHAGKDRTPDTAESKVESEKAIMPSGKKK